MKAHRRRTRGVAGFLAAFAVPTAALLAVSIATASRSGATGSSAGGSTTADCANVFGGDVCVSAAVASDRVLEVGVTVPMRTIEAASSDGGMVWPPVRLGALAMPAEVRRLTGLQFFDIYWEPHGHPPGSYLVPHFDFHLYGVTLGEATSIDCADETRPKRLPPGYALPNIEVPDIGTLVGICVPAMGMHAVPERELKDAAPFEATMLVGYYHGRPIFLEPMIARDRLLRRESFDLPVPAIPEASHSVRFPTAFRAEYHADARAYRLVFTGFGH